MNYLGVDFSGARDAGKRIWIAEGVERSGQIVVEALYPARELSGSVQRDESLAALQKYIGDLGNSVIGIDAPNSLPLQLMNPDWAVWFAAIAAHGSAQVFKANCTSRWMKLTGSREKEGRRGCDREAGTPFSAWNERLYRQTWYLLTGIYAPLLAAKKVTIAPYQKPESGKPRLAEICPASTLKRLELYGTKYKVKQASTVRENLLAALGHRASLQLSSSLQRITVEDGGGDALDALIALAAVVRRRKQIAKHDPASEGEIYVWD